jgi:hypothetical protein
MVVLRQVRGGCLGKKGGKTETSARLWTAVVPKKAEMWPEMRFEQKVLTMFTPEVK